MNIFHLTKIIVNYILRFVREFVMKKGRKGRCTPSCCFDAQFIEERGNLVFEHTLRIFIVYKYYY